MIDDKTYKLLSRALHPSVAESDSAHSWDLARQRLRAVGVQIEDLLAAASPAEPAGPQIVINEGPPGEWDVVMPWGKHKGKTLGEIYQQHAGYLDWCLANATNLRGSLRRAVEIIVNGA